MHTLRTQQASGLQSRVGSLSEASLIAASKSGDRNAFRHLYDDNFEIVFQYLRHRLPFHEAEDITADVFCSAWTDMPNYEWRGTPFRAWLLVIAKNRIRNRARRRAVVSFCTLEPHHLDEGALRGADVDALNRIDIDALAFALERVEDHFKAVLKLRFIEDMSVRETATRLRCSDESVRVRTFRGLQQLRAQMRRDLD